MEREIKFRAYDPDTQRMYQDVIVGRAGNLIALRYTAEEESTDLELLYWTCANDKSPKPIIVMQFTGLLDKNKKEIYEGDIVKIQLIGWGESKEDYIGSVIFKDGAFFIDNIIDTKYKEPKCQYRPHNSILISQHELYEVLGKTYIPNYGEVFTFSEHATYVEIIGNIHANPELLTSNTTIL